MSKKTETETEQRHPLDGLAVEGVVANRYIDGKDAWLAPHHTFELLDDGSMLITQVPNKDYTGRLEIFLLSAGTWLARMKRKEV